MDALFPRSGKAPLFFGSHASYDRKAPSPLPSRRVVLALCALVVAVPVALHALLAYSPLATSSTLYPPALAAAKNALVVVAHPDDEALFFSPTLTTLRSRGARTHVLVISTGDHYGLGWRRQQELVGSCAALGVAPDHCAVLDESDLRDAPRQWWASTRIEDIVRAKVRAWGIDVVISFDESGISGHLNHRATSAAVSNLAIRDASFPPTYLLRTVHYKRFGGHSLLEMIPAAAPFAWRWLIGADDSQALLVSTYSDYLRGRRAFGAHASQGGWDSWLWRSRYMFANRLRRVEHGKRPRPAGTPRSQMVGSATRTQAAPAPVLP